MNPCSVVGRGASPFISATFAAAARALAAICSPSVLIVIGLLQV
jgi:hypothetical protein